MFGIPQRAWLLALLVPVLAVIRFVPEVRADICHIHPPPCMDTELLQQHANGVAQNLSTADDWRILIQLKYFKKITRMPKLHSCVMTRVGWFFELALRRKLGLGMNDPPGNHSGPIMELIGLMQHVEGCTRTKKEKCKGLFAKANKQAVQKPIKKMQPRDWAIQQIQHLNQAEKNLGEPGTLDKVLDELKLLHNYFKGSGIRRWERQEWP